LNPEYWEYGSDGEPQVHVLTGINGVYFDTTTEWELGKISGMGDFYTSTKCDWRPLKREQIYVQGNDTSHEKWRKSPEYLRMKELFMKELRESVTLKELQEGFRLKDMDKFIPTLFAYLSKKMKKKIHICGYSPAYENKYGKFVGVKGLIPGGEALRFNVSLGDVSGNIVSFDYWANPTVVPSWTKEFSAMDNIVTITNEILMELQPEFEPDLILDEGVLSEKINKEALQSAFDAWVEMATLSTIRSMKMSGQLSDFNEFLDTRFEDFGLDKPNVSRTVFTPLIQKLYKDNNIEMGAKKPGSPEKVIVNDPEAKKFGMFNYLPVDIQYKTVKAFTLMVAAKKAKIAIFSGPKGQGKSVQVFGTLNRVASERGIRFQSITGSIKSAVDLWKYLYDNRNEKLIVFDDADLDAKNAAMNNILKGILDSNPEKRNVVQYQHPEIERSRDYETEMEFNAGLIFITNLPAKKLDAAVVDRARHANVLLTKDDMLRVIKKNIEKFPPFDVDFEFKKKAFNWLLNNYQQATKFSLRTFEKVVQNFSSGFSEAVIWNKMEIGLAISEADYADVEENDITFDSLEYNLEMMEASSPEMQRWMLETMTTTNMGPTPEKPKKKKTDEEEDEEESKED
jgi:hypothetical protein